MYNNVILLSNNKSDKTDVLVVGDRNVHVRLLCYYKIIVIGTCFILLRLSIKLVMYLFHTYLHIIFTGVLKQLYSKSRFTVSSENLLAVELISN